MHCRRIKTMLTGSHHIKICNKEKNPERTKLFSLKAKYETWSSWGRRVHWVHQDDSHLVWAKVPKSSKMSFKVDWDPTHAI